MLALIFPSVAILLLQLLPLPVVEQEFILINGTRVLQRQQLFPDLDPM